MFNGSSSKIVTGVNLTLQSACSLSVWVYFTGSNFFPIFGGNNTISGTSTTINRHYAAINAGASRFDYINKAGAFWRSTNLSPFNSNAWNHIVITDDFTNNTTSSKLYVNGTQDTNFVRIITSYGGAVNTNLYIGQSRTNANGQQYATGTLDQVRIFPTVITQAQVTELYEDEIECCTTDEVNYPVTNTAYYKLNGNATDSTTNGYNGTWTGTAAYGAGLFDDAAVFNGVNQTYVKLPSAVDTILNTKNFGISFWVKAPNATTDAAFSTETTNSTFQVHANWTIANRYALINGGGNNLNLGPIDSSWHHIVVTSDGSSSYKGYFDGVYKGTVPYRQTSNVGTFLGAHPGGNFALNGSIDQVRIFPTALTAGQVAELYQEKLCGCTTDTIDYPTTNTAYYQLNGGTGTTVTDETGAYNGTSSNVTYAAGQFDDAAVFNGSSSVITSSSAGTAINVSNLSFSLWLNTNNTSTAHKIFLSQYDESGNSRFYFSLKNNGIVLVVYNASNAYIQNFPNIISTNQWYHIAITQTSTATKLYLNGQLQTASSSTGSPLSIRIASSPPALYFGQLQLYPGTFPFNGELDQVRIFNTVLTAGQVADLYREIQC